MSTVLTQPTACIYNGYRLPVLDFLDKYPYVLICKENVFQYELYCSSSPINIETNSNGDYLLVREAPHCIKYYNQYDKTWRLTSEYTSQSKTYMRSLGIPIWSSHKITYPNGTVYISASNEPSALYEGHTEEDDGGIDLYSFTVGLVFGLSDDLSLIENSMFEDDDYVPPAREPVAYLYNDVRLPPLPDIDRTVYPYVAIFDLYVQNGHTGGYTVLATSEPGVFVTRETGMIFNPVDDYVTVPATTDWKTYVLTSTDGWLPWSENDGTIKMEHLARSFIWTNYDIVDSEGTVHIAASEPVPVYE